MRRQVGSSFIQGATSTSTPTSSSSISSSSTSSTSTSTSLVPQDTSKRTRGVTFRVIGVVACCFGSFLFHVSTTATATATATKQEGERSQDKAFASEEDTVRILPQKVNFDTISQAPTDSSSSSSTSTSTSLSNATVVTAYFSMASKFPKERYNSWMSNMLSLQDSMVIYTSPNLVEHMKNLRKHAPTVVIGMELEDLPLGGGYSAEFWQRQLDQDPEKSIHRSYQLFWIWLSKSWFVTDAIQRNYFSSQVYIWSDIGCFRVNTYNHKRMMIHYELLPSNSTLQMAHHETEVPDYVWWNNKYKQKPKFYHSGSQMAAYKDVWHVWHKEYTATIQGFIQRNMFIGEDQTVAQSTCLRLPDLCRYVPTKQVTKDNHYFGLRYVLHHGGNYTYWRPPDGLPAEPSDINERKKYQV